MHAGDLLPAEPAGQDVQDLADYKAFYEIFVRDQLVYKGKRSWADAANVVLTERDRQSAF